MAQVPWAGTHGLSASVRCPMPQRCLRYVLLVSDVQCPITFPTSYDACSYVAYSCAICPTRLGYIYIGHTYACHNYIGHNYIGHLPCRLCSTSDIVRPELYVRLSFQLSHACPQSCFGVFYTFFFVVLLNERVAFLFGHRPDLPDGLCQLLCGRRRPRAVAVAVLLVQPGKHARPAGLR